MKQHRTITRLAATSLIVLGVLHLVGIVILPFLGYDYYCQQFWIGDWHKMWQAGILYPRWLPDSYRGFGAPSFYFYPPLTYLFSSALYTIASAFHAATIAKLEIGLTLALSGLTLWLYLRWRAITLGLATNRISIILPALLFVFAPYRYFDYQIRSAVSEHVAFIFVPLVFWGIDILLNAEKKDWRVGSVLLSFSFALLLITNLPTSALIGISLIVYVLASKANKHQLYTIVLSLIGAALLAVFYLLPVATLFSDVQLGRLWAKVSVWQSSPFTAIFTGRMITINAYALIMVVGGLFAFAAWLRSKQNARAEYLGLLMLAIFLQMPVISQVLFSYVPPFTIVQLSYRFSVVILFVVAIAWQNELSVPQKPIVSWIVTFWSVTGIALISLQLSGFRINKHIPLPVDDAPEYAPKWSRPYYDWGAALSAPFKSDSESVVWQGPSQPSTARVVRIPYSDTVEYENAQPAIALFRRSYWPTWQARIDDRSALVRPDSLGRAFVDAPAGHHKIILWLEAERSAEIGTYISLSTLVVFAIVGFARRKKRTIP